jgi:hypothetical protein
MFRASPGVRLRAVVAESLQKPNLLVAVAIAALVLFTILARPLLIGQVPTSDDMGHLNLPIRAFYARCLVQGEPFDWMPQIYGGAYLTGDGNNVSYHPLEWLLYRWLPVPLAVHMDALLPCVILLFGMAWFLRRYVNDAGAWTGALFFTFSVKWLAHLQHHPFLMTMAHIPWLLGAMQVAVTTTNVRHRRLAGAAIAFLTGSQFLFGFPQALWFSLITECGFAICLLFHRPRAWKAWATVAIGKLLGVCMGAVKLFGTLSFLAESSRGAVDPGFANQYALAPHRIVGIIAPYLLFDGVTGWAGIYFGAIPLTLAVWWLCAGMWDTSHASGPNGGENFRSIRQLSFFAAILGILTLWLSPGFAWKLYYLQTYLPVVGKLRCPDRFHMLTTFCVVVLSALAFSWMIGQIKRREKLSWRSMLPPWLLFVISMLVASYFFFSGQAAQHHPGLGCLFFGPLFFGLAAVAFTIAGRGYRFGLLLLIIIGAIDLGLYGLGNRAATKMWQKSQNYQEYLAAISGPPDVNAGRVYDTSPTADILWLHGYRLINGYMGGMAPQRQLDYRHVNTLRVAEVAWFFDYWTPGDVAGLSRPKNGSCWWRVPNPLPRARLVTRAVASASPGEDLKKIDVDHVVLVTHPIELPNSHPGDAKLTEDRPGRISLNVAAPNQQILAISETYHSGWNVHVDGQRVPLERINGDFIGCVVEGGRHHVEFVFLPALLHWGRIVSLLGLALGVCWIATPAWFGALPKGDRSADSSP